MDSVKDASETTVEAVEDVIKNVDNILEDIEFFLHKEKIFGIAFLVAIIIILNYN